jgi:hypothetical protein
MRRKVRTGKAAVSGPARRRDAGIDEVPTVRADAEPVVPPPAAAEEEDAVEAVRRMVEAAYT